MPVPARAAQAPSTDLGPWWVDAAVLVPLYCLYMATRGLADALAADAVAFGWSVQQFSEALHLDVELGLNHWLLDVPVLAIACCYYYATLHFIVTPAVLLWMRRRHPARYRPARLTLALTTVISLAGFLAFPTAPPRLLDGSGYVDTMAAFAAWGWWSESSSAAPARLEVVANQYAALPSVHCAWALWCGVLLIRHARRRFVRVLGAIHPAATTFVVVATANHYLVDAFAGWAVLACAACVATAATRRRVRLPKGRSRKRSIAPGRFSLAART
jgi:hypothetical protein